MSDSILTYPKQGRLSALQAWIAGELGTCVVHLFDTFHALSPDDTPASFHESGFPGYGPVGGIAWSAPFINGAGKAETDSNLLHWGFTGLVGSAFVYGMFCTNLAGTKLLWATEFLSAVQLTPPAPDLNKVAQVTETSEV